MGTMTKRMEEAFAHARELPEAEQDELADALLAQLEWGGRMPRCMKYSTFPGNGRMSLSHTCVRAFSQSGLCLAEIVPTANSKSQSQAANKTFVFRNCGNRWSPKMKSARKINEYVFTSLTNTHRKRPIKNTASAIATFALTASRS